MLTIYNTLSRKKERFKPHIDNKVNMYVCGMTVYDLCHIGHGRTVTAFDMIARYLRARGYELTYIRNITDIDDKIIKRAQENNENYTELTQKMIQAMHQDFAQLGNLPPDQEPCATAFIPQMIIMIQNLITKNYAYVSNGDVYYKVRKFADYGQLSGKILNELDPGARIDIDQDKQDPLDFVLWKSAKPGEPSWSSPWGMGRPGWHIECSSMSKHCLGDTLDIHGGGADLVFPHHENEIAQSEAANHQHFVNFWMHSGAIRVDNVKMSKSLHNFFTIRDVLTQHHPETVRYFLISSHYRSPMNYSEMGLKEAHIKLQRFYTALQGLDTIGVSIPDNSDYQVRFFAAMDDDFNTPVALAVLFELAKKINKTRKNNSHQALSLAALLRYLSHILGILQGDPEKFLKYTATVDSAWIESMIMERNAAKKAKDFVRSDAIRNELLVKGVVLQDNKEGIIQWRIKQ